MNLWRKFESEQAFADWHEQSKQLLDMPIVGVRASDGVPQPGKQQTTDYTALTYRDLEVDSDEEPIIPAEPPLDAVVADDSIIEQVSVLVRADMMLPEELAALANVYPAWEAGQSVEVGDLRSYGDMLWKVVQAHTTQADWQPDVARSLWVRTAPPDVIPEWAQPLGAHDAYPVGYQVTHNGQVWTNNTAANTWEPGIFGWDAEAGEGVADWVQPTGGHDAYSIGARVMHNGQEWESTANANVWEPGVFGWIAV